ncbi:MAG: NADH-quinone oxidoreductase subunit J [Rhodococcus sp.]|nr:NADH-quinone oxidoreductase subunit J [Rhodococcus sp. (in: high G+C Gram-positive bacteria)]
MTARAVVSDALLAADGVAQTSTAEGVQFWVLAVVAVIGALGVVCATKAVYSALFLAMTMIILAVFYIAQGALFLGVVQIVVYTGAVMMLFLFVLMLVGVDSSESLVETLRGQRVAAIVAGLGFGVLLIAGLGNVGVLWSRSPGADLSSGADSGVEGLAELIFVRYVWAFELTGALLITATLGAMVLAHRERLQPRKGQRAMSEDRFRDWADSESSPQVTSLPSSGVYARRNAVDVPARLADGSYSALSVNRLLTPRNPDEHPDENPDETVSPDDQGGER